MKAKRLWFELTLIVAIAALLVWKFWLAKDSTAATAAASAMPAPAKAAVLPATPSTAQVEAPKLPPVQVALPPDSLSVPGNGGNLYDTSKARAALTSPAQNGDDDYNAVVNGSPGLAKLHDILAQKESLAQSLSFNDNTALPPPKNVVTDLGQIILTQDQPIMRILASGDEAVLTLVARPNAPGRFGSALTIRTSFLFQNGNEWVEYPGRGSGLIMLNGPSVTSGQEMTVKSVASGNEIHFVPVFASPEAK